MQLTRLICSGFRCLKDLSFQPGPGLNLIVGANAQGKTSLLESLLYVATARSHRTTQDLELVQYGGQGFRIAAWVERRARPVVIEAAYYNGAKRFRVNGVPQTRVSDILGKINVVSFFAEDVALVRGAASQRRRLLDIELSKVYPQYLRSLQQYRQVLRQRNEVLRKKPMKPEELITWDVQLVAYAQVLMEHRASFVRRLTDTAEAYYARIAGEGESLTLAYRPDVRSDMNFGEVIALARETDQKQGMTTRGPHRDDVDILINAKPARQFASQGQQRSAALAIKLATADWVQEATEEDPILALDDVFSELDPDRASRLLEVLSPHRQSLITSTDGLVERLPAENRKLFWMEGGRLEEK